MTRFPFYFVLPAAIALTLVLPGSAQIQLYVFQGGATCGNSQSWLVSDAVGNLYGTAEYGGQYNQGCVFELVAPTKNGGEWRESVLYSFKGGNGDGATPLAGLVFDSAGNLFGSTVYGGPNSHGVIFELRPTGEPGVWAEEVLHFFNGLDGATPSGLLVGSGGALYGTSPYGGDNGAGNVFRLAIGKDDNWHLQNLYSFEGVDDGLEPAGSLIADSQQNLYGVTVAGGAYDRGSVFKLEYSKSDGKFTESVLYSFTGANDGEAPRDSLVSFNGSLYGTAGGGGAYGDGVVFQLNPSGNSWTESVLHDFEGGSDGARPWAGLAHDGQGNLYGTTPAGGIGICSGFAGPGCGIVFELSAPQKPGDDWVEHKFQFLQDIGVQPMARVLLTNNHLYGTTFFGGASGKCLDAAGCGIVFQLSH